MRCVWFSGRALAWFKLYLLEWKFKLDSKEIIQFLGALRMEFCQDVLCAHIYICHTLMIMHLYTDDLSNF